jgi:hypothetical protein
VAREGSDRVPGNGRAEADGPVNAREQSAVALGRQFVETIFDLIKHAGHDTYAADCGEGARDAPGSPGDETGC